MKHLQLFTVSLCALGLCYLTGEEAMVSMTPAEDQAASAQQDTDPEMWQNSPMKQSMNRAQKKFPSEDHKEAYTKLSPKNQAAYDTLSEEDQNKIADTEKSGGDPQATLADILADDQDEYEANPPATDDKGLNPKVPKTAPSTKAMEDVPADQDDEDDTDDES